MYWTYAIFSSSHNRIYVGHTNDLSRRLSEHNGQSGFKGWTVRYR
ncbi:MAG: GIY-YIG nuclease family protein, partial [Bacteroidota bacterium]